MVAPGCLDPQNRLSELILIFLLGLTLCSMMRYVPLFRSGSFLGVGDLESVCSLCLFVSAKFTPRLRNRGNHQMSDQGLDDRNLVPYID